MNPPAGLEATEFAEVVYRTDDVLVVSVAADLAEDSLLTGALMDVIATADQCDTAELAIANLASDLDLEVQLGAGHGERHVTILPPVSSEWSVRQPAPASDGRTART
jgi:hypothetical protein